MTVGSMENQSVTTARESGLVSLGDVNHLVGSTATVLTKPQGKTSLFLDVESGSFRLKKGSYASLGPELLTNTDFATDTNWTKGTGWSISAGVASSDASQSADSDLTQTLGGTLIEGELYTAVFTVSNRTAGEVSIVIGGTEGTARATNATFTQDIVAGSSQEIAIRADADFDGDVDNVSVKVAVLKSTTPTTVSGGAGSLKLREDRTIGITAPTTVTVKGSGATDILTYYWT